MRIAFLVLMLANLVFLLWHTQIRGGDEHEALPQIPPDKRLVLLAEHQRKEKSAAGEPAPAVDPIAGLPDITVSDESGPAEPESEPEPASGAGPEPGTVCHTLGPFKDLKRAREVTRRLEHLGADVNRRSKVEQEQYGYRVYLKPFATREEAVAEARKLAEHGIRDYYIIADEDDHENGLSLGLFRKKSGAVRRMAQVRRFDVEPHMEIRYRDTTIYWLDYELPDDMDSRPLWRELTEETPDLQRLDRECPPQ